MDKKVKEKYVVTDLGARRYIRNTQHNIILSECIKDLKEKQTILMAYPDKDVILQVKKIIIREVL